jgi:hypothetical protein
MRLMFDISLPRPAHPKTREVLDTEVSSSILGDVQVSLSPLHDFTLLPVPTIMLVVPYTFQSSSPRLNFLDWDSHWVQMS